MRWIFKLQIGMERALELSDIATLFQLCWSFMSLLAIVVLWSVGGLRCIRRYVLVLVCLTFLQVSISGLNLMLTLLHFFEQDTHAGISISPFTAVPSHDWMILLTPICISLTSACFMLLVCLAVVIVPWECCLDHSEKD